MALVGGRSSSIIMMGMVKHRWCREDFGRRWWTLPTSFYITCPGLIGPSPERALSHYGINAMRRVAHGEAGGERAMAVSVRRGFLFPCVNAVAQTVRVSMMVRVGFFFLAQDG